MKKVFAVGPREQDFADTNGFFCGSITLYGSGKGGNISYSSITKNRINHNIVSKAQGEFVEKMMLKQIEEDSEVYFMSYDPNQAFDCDDRIIKRTLCLNDKTIMDIINNKISFRNWASDVCRVHRSVLLNGSECVFSKLKNIFKGYDSFVVQSDYATGGEGTYIMTEHNEKEVKKILNSTGRYLVSGYEVYNIPINTHAIIYEHEILFFPISIQIMQLNGIKLLYQGSDFKEANRINEDAVREFRIYMENICLKLQKEGFRGITGVDGMIVDGRVYILEMNNRFQGSTILLNLALKDAGLPSMQELNFESFYNKAPACYFEDLDVPYSCFTYIANEEGHPFLGHKRNFNNEKNVIAIYDEGLCYDWKIAPYATLEKVVFDTNIVSITEDNRVELHPNIPDMEDFWFNEIAKNKNLLYLKIALINQGVTFRDDAKEFLKTNGGMREGVYNAVDIYIRDIVINSAVTVKFTALSPFNIRTSQKGLELYICDTAIAEIEIKSEDILSHRVTSSGIEVKDICMLATDRVRVQHSTNCCFKKCNVGCHFCEVDNHDFSFVMEDIFEAIDMYIASEYQFRHFLVGGRTDFQDKEAEEIIKIVQYINKHGKWPVYVMCIPPKKREILKRFYDAHVTEIALNLEIWDRTLAKKWMPGKGAITRERYMEMLEYATELWGKDGDVRSAFIVGLEPKESLMEGIREVCKIGVAPILSVFRAIPGTKGEHIVPPTNEKLLSIYQDAKEICNEYGLKLGPKCIPCQNNTLSLF